MRCDAPPQVDGLSHIQLVVDPVAYEVDCNAGRRSSWYSVGDDGVGGWHWVGGGVVCKKVCEEANL